MKNKKKQKEAQSLGKEKKRSGIKIDEDNIEGKKRNNQLDSYNLIYQRAVEALRESEQKYHNLLEQANNGIAIIQDGKCKYINHRLAKIFGYSVEELIDTAIIKHIHPSEIPKLTDRYERRIAGEKIPQVYETKIKLKNGLEKYVEINAVIINYQEEPADFAIIRDITDRKLMEEALSKSEERFRTLVEATSDWIWEVDKNGVYTYASPKVKDLLGYDPEEVIGKTPFDLMPPEEAKRMAGWFRDVIKSQKSFAGLENTNLHKDGRSIVLETSGVPIFDSNGNLSGYHGIDRNITDRKKAEEVLRGSEEKYRSLVDGTNDAIITVDLNGNITSWNKAARKMMGYDKKEVMGKPIAMLAPEEIRDEQKTVIMKVKEVGFIKDYETIRVTKRGVRIPVELSLNAMKDNGGVIVGISGIIKDITERKRAEKALLESEERNRQLIDSAQYAIYTIKPDGKIVTLNPAWETITGLPREEWIGKSFALLVHPDDISSVMEHFQLAVKGKKPPDYEARFITSSSEYRLGRFSIFPQFKDGKVSSISGIAYDITERKQAEEKLKKSYEQLRNLSAHLQIAREEERTLIAREIHDELSQVLTAVKIELAVVGGKITKADDKESRLRLSKEIKYLLKLIDNTLQSVRNIIQDLKPEILDQFGVQEAMEWYIKEYQTRTGIKCETNLDMENTRLDKNRSIAVFRIFQESLTNIARHARANRVKINLTEESGNLLLTIKDNGKGIREEQISDSKSIGLIGMRERALFLGGELEIQGVQGKGSTVMLKLPLSN